jgi:exonuclease SbcC
MKPLWMKMTSFQSYRGEHPRLDFLDKSPIVLSGRNGSGKSSIFDAMRWTCFGFTRGDINSCITDGEEICKVEFSFDHDGQQYLISRQRSKRGNGTTTLALIFFDGTTDEHGEPGMQNLAGRTVTETQKKIEELLAMDDELFCASACASQGNADDFSRAQPARRKEVLADLLRLDLWEPRAKRARERAADARAQITAYETSASQLEAKADRKVLLWTEIEANGIRQAGAQAAVDQWIKQIADLGADRTALEKEQETDAGKRRELKEFREQKPALIHAMEAGRTEVDGYQRKIALKAEVLAGIQESTKAAEDVQTLEAVRLEADRLDKEIILASSRVETAKANQKALLGTHRQNIERIEKSHERDLKDIDEKIARQRASALLIGKVPCTVHPEMVKACAFLERARAAQQELPQLEAERLKLVNSEPWSAEFEIVSDLEKQQPWVADEVTLAKARDQRKASPYDEAAHSKAKVAAAKAPTWASRHAEVVAAEEALPAATERLKAATDAVKRCQEQIDLYLELLGEEKPWVALLADLDQSISVAQTEQEIANKLHRDLVQAEGQLRQQYADAEAAALEAAEKRALAQGLSKRLSLLNILGNPTDGAFSRHGIPGLLIERAIPQLEAEANQVLSILSDGQISLELRTQREKADRGVAETLDIVITDSVGPRLYETYSGGEKMRCDIALHVGLGMVLAARSGARCDMLLFDETCAPMDDRGREQFVECLNAISGQFTCVMVVTHLPSLIDAFPYCFHITKDDQGSHIRVEAR